MPNAQQMEKDEDDGNESLNDVKSRLITYLRFCLQIDGIVVQSTAVLNLTIGQHPSLIHHFQWRDLTLIIEMKRKQMYVKLQCEEKRMMEAEHSQRCPRVTSCWRK